MTRRIILILCLLCTLSSLPAADRPNIVVLFADDMGFSDIGCFGSEIQTPNLDRLAKGGLRFTHFYNTGRCCPSRASIMTGLYPHQADIGHMAGGTGVKGYRDRLSFNAVTLAEVLGRAGYHTIMTGKWHLGWRDEGCPTARGFQHFYGTRGFIDSYYTVVPKTEIYLGEKLVLPATRKPVNHLKPDEEWYTTDVFTDYAIHFIDQVRASPDNNSRNKQSPFFLYLAYNAPHFPLHAKPEDTAKYRGKYKAGWANFRRQRYAQLVKLGIVDKDWPLSPLDVPEWETLTDEQRDDMDFKMALFAAIIDRLDQNIGRLVDHLEKIGELDNTLLVFVSDNGGTRETGLMGIKGDKNTVKNYQDWGRLGGWSSSYGQGWANLSNVPFRRYKRENHEGGVSAPAIIHWPSGMKAKGQLRHQVAHLIDLMPTFVEVSGAAYPEEFKGNPIQPMEGRSLVPFFDTGQTEPRTLFWEHEGNRAVREGDWKLVGSRGGPWELYHIARDRTELNDLATKEAARFASLKTAWDGWAKKVNVLTPAEFEAARRAHRDAQRGASKIELPAPTRAEHGKVVFKDDFSDGEMKRWSIHGGNWKEEDGVLTVQGVQGPRVLVKDLNLADFEVEVEIKVDANTQAGIVFRVDQGSPGIDSYRGYYAGMHGQKNQVMWGASLPGWREIARKPGPVAAGKWHRLRVTARGAKVACFLDSVPATNAGYPRVDGVDQRFQTGLLGFRVLGGNASFRNLIVRGYAPPPLKSGYTNPVQAACADPVVLKHNGRYYAYCTSTPDFPDMPVGIRLYTSADLVHWVDRGYVLKREDSWGESRFWAPDIVEKDGTFFLYYAADTRICVATAKSPLGPFTQSVKKPMEPASIRIDAHVFEDDDGQRYFYYVRFNKGNEIWGGVLNDDMISVDESSLRLMIKADQPWEQQRGHIVEGAEVIKHNGIYYLTYSGSHFESPDYAVGYATSDSPLGPWKKHDFNPIMKSTRYAHGTAHHCLTTSPDGSERFIVYHRHFTLADTEPRQMSIDRIRFVPQESGPDTLEVWGPTSSPQPMPSRGGAFQAPSPPPPSSGGRGR